MSRFALKVKTKTGHQIVSNLNSNSTMKELKETLSNLSKIPPNRLHVLFGYPPKPVDVTEDNIILSETGISSGDTLILEEKFEAALPKEPVTTNNQNTSDHLLTRPTKDNANSMGILMKHVVPADNSCLFSSIHFVLNGKVDENGKHAKYMRELIAQSIANDKETFSEAILGKPNHEYCKWILDDKSWGGGIEIAILSNHYGIEIAVVDTTSGIINRFGEDQNYGSRVFLLFDGIHYDPLYVECAKTGKQKTIFVSTNVQLLQDAEDLAKEAKSSRQFTDVNKFTLKCLECSIYLVGQEQASKHAQLTGHDKFGEV